MKYVCSTKSQAALAAGSMLMQASASAVQATMHGDQSTSSKPAARSHLLGWEHLRY